MRNRRQRASCSAARCVAQTFLRPQKTSSSRARPRSLNQCDSPIHMPPTLAPTNPCPVCGETQVVRIDPNSLNFSAVSHQCTVCTAILTGILSWKVAAKTTAIGLAFMLCGLAAYEASKLLTSIPNGVRLVAFVTFLASVFGYSANRIVSAI